MARKLSRIAQFAFLIAAAIFAWPATPRASADGNLQFQSPSETIQNPFAHQSPAAQPPTAPPEETGPRTYQNPFSANPGLPPTTASQPSRGTLSRWRRPTQLPGNTALPSNPAPDSNAPTPNPFVPSSSPAPLNSSWDVLSPSQLQDAKAKSLGEPIAEPVDLQGTATSALPDPAQYVPNELQQPSWLVPSPASDTSEATPPKKIPYPSINVRTPPPTAAAGRVTPLPKPMAAPSFGMRQTDPFDSVEPAVVSDASSTRPTSAPMPQLIPPSNAPASVAPPVPQSQNNPYETTTKTIPAPTAPIVAPPTASASEYYDRAEHAAETAQSLDQLAGVDQLCEQGLAAHPARDLASRLGSLAAWARNRHGELQSDAGNDADALADFNAALQLDSNCWLALHNRAVSLAQQGHGAEALRDFNRVIKLSPGMAIAYRNRGELLASMGRTEEAVADYGRAINQLPDEADLYEIRGHALHRLGRYQDALADLDHAIQLSPRSSDTFTHRGNVYAELGDYNHATSDFQHALELNSNCADAYRSLAWLEATCPDARFRDPQQAVVAAENAAKLSPQGDCFVLDALAAAYASAGNFDQAVRAQKQAMAIAPKSFSPQFAQRLALYQQHHPYHNEAAAPDHQVRAASLDTPADQSR